DPTGPKSPASEHGAEGRGLVPPAPSGVELGGAAELGGDDDQGRVEATDPFEVVDQGRDRVGQFDDQTVLLELAAVVGVPTGAVHEIEVVRDLDEPDPCLNQPTGQQAALTELATVLLATRGGLAVELEHLPKRRPREPGRLA